MADSPATNGFRVSSIPADASEARVDAGPGRGSDGETLASLCDLELDPMFWNAERRGALSAWWSHVPFAHWLVGAVAPRTLVELGTHTGVSYSAFCQAVSRFRLGTRCFAVDTWAGDQHAGFYTDDVYCDFRTYHDARYASFSTLLRARTDPPRPQARQTDAGQPCLI